MKHTAEPSREWSISDAETVYQGFYQLEKITFTHALFNGGDSGAVEREQFVRGNVVGVLVHDPELDKIALVEQFRIGARLRDKHPWLLEIIAGMVEKNEEPKDVAIREAYEEAGLTLNNVSEMCNYLASPGASTEQVTIFYANADLANAGGIFGLPEEGEDIMLHVLDTEEVFAKVDRGEICNALSLIALQRLRIQRLQS